MSVSAMTAACRRQPPRRRRVVLRAVTAGASLLAVVFAVGWLAFDLAVRWWPYPDALARRTQPSLLALDRAGVPLTALASPDGSWRLPLDEQGMNPLLECALIAAEDRRFREHHGVDWLAVLAACWQDVRSLHCVRGASTITMQVQRLRDPRPRGLATKLRESVRACQIERGMGKDAILREYLERAPFGANVVGASAASWRWFGRPCAALSLSQCALLAALPQNPTRLRPDRHPLEAAARRDRILVAMEARGDIDHRQCLAAMAEPMTAVWRPLPQGDFVDGGLEPSLCDLAACHSGGIISTTLDATMQRSASAAAARALDALAGSSAEAVAVAVVVIDNQAAEYRALVSLGGPGYLDLTRARRSPGSTLKPFIYAAAFAVDACAPGSTVSDDPGGWTGFAPQDFDRVFRGSMTAAEALADSRNLPAMRLLETAGLSRVAGTMEAAGLGGMSRAAERAGLSLAIGGAETSPREVAEAYATIARGGVHRCTALVATVGSSSGSSSGSSTGSSTGSSSGVQVLPSRACWQVIHCLDARSRTVEISSEAAALDVAWKTGTSSGQRDAWCAAITPRFTVVAWIGTRSGKGDAALIGSHAAAPLALSLIAALDPGGPGWEGVAAPEVAAIERSSSRASRALPATLVITAPTQGCEVVADPDVPVERQRLALRSSGGGPGLRWWFDAAVPLGSCAAGETVWIVLTPGRHRLRVIDGSGHAAEVEVMVREGMATARR